MSERQDIHVHVEQDEPRYERDVAAEEGAAAASFFTAQLLWIVLIAVVIILIVAALGSGVIDLGAASDAVDPTAAP